MKIEIVCDRIENAIRAAQLGADRIELCSCLSIGGISPHSSMVKILKDHIDIPIMALIRPRGGNFVYSKLEKEQILLEIDHSIRAGAQGVVVGALTAANQLDIDFLHLIRKKYNHTELCCHRAFDFVEDPILALDQLIEIGFDRLLSSGKEPTALQGIKLLKTLIEQSKNRITIMPGSGINWKNIKQLYQYLKIEEIHLSSKKVIRHDDQASVFAIEEWKLDEIELQQFLQEISFFDNS